MMKKQSNKILIVDDDSDLLSDLALILSWSNEILKAESSSIALHLFGKYLPGICVIDICLPAYLQNKSEIEGIRLAEKFVSKKPGTKIILISKNHFPAIEPNIPEFDFLQKPFSIKSLRTKL